MHLKPTVIFLLFLLATSCSSPKNIGGLETVKLSKENIDRLLAQGFVSYSDFGAKGDGVNDDMNALAATHKFANEHGLMVKADDGVRHYIGPDGPTAIIQTDTDFGTAAFIVDDSKIELEKRGNPVFIVSSKLESFNPIGINSLKRNQKKIDIALPGPCLITVTNSNVKHYIRFGLNQNNGSDQTDIFLVDKDGNVDMNAPIIWDFDSITEITAQPIDQDTLRIKGGHFTTIANQAESKYNYHSRNISIKRSNVIVDGLQHHITGEGEHGAPYRGFISVHDCSNVTVKNTILTGHKTYRTIGNAGKPVSMGSYDLSVGRALNVSFINCTQTNDITDRTYWGILGSNYCKNLLYDGCTLSRFDAHKGVANATVRNSTLGHMGINAIGSGTFTLENSTVKGKRLINLRGDYGSTWEGKLIIRDCIFIPEAGMSRSPSLINGGNSGQHDFGYTCYMPELITIENLQIDDSNYLEDLNGPTIFGNFNSKMTDETYIEKYPYNITKDVVLKNVSIVSGKPLRLSENQYMFRNVKIGYQ